jgi:hypothetical protein
MNRKIQKAFKTGNTAKMEYYREQRLARAYARIDLFCDRWTCGVKK